MTEKILFLEPGDEQAQKIAKAMGSKAASDILQLLGDGQSSLTDITERLSLPMNTAKYHVENLLDAGLISIAETKYSVKGREVKVYSLTNQLLVVAPRQSTMRSLILKYASLFGVVVLGTVAIAGFTSVFGPESMLRASANTVNAAPRYALAYDGGIAGSAANAAVETAARNITAAHEVAVGAAKGLADTWTANVSAVTTAALPPEPVAAQIAQPLPMEAVAPGLDPVLMFFLGGIMVVLVLLCYEAWLWKKTK
jgi:DNA-binding transcriptional ArsR family regulator